MRFIVSMNYTTGEATATDKAKLRIFELSRESFGDRIFVLDFLQDAIYEAKTLYERVLTDDHLQ